MGSPDQGDRVGRLMEEYSPILLAYFHRRVNDAADAADLLNDALLVIWRRTRAVPTDDAEARMWFFGVARRVLATHRRTGRRRSALGERLRAELTNGSTVEDADDVMILRETLKQLPPIDQEIIRLIHWDGFSQVEAAQLLEMPEGTLRSRHLRARLKLRDLLKAQQTHAGTTST